VLWVLITVVGLVVGWGRGVVGWGMVDDWGRGIGWGMVNNSMVNRGMDGMVNRGMDCMVNSRGSMVDGVTTESCKGNGWAASHKRDKSYQSKDLHGVVM